ncbi:MAG: nucleoside monophosphate kinase [Candidatus Nealsonbacteria bacterium]|nr:nucleoside monophosphate kinase [Candidatus Nealsonbacteria bacterium]
MKFPIFKTKLEGQKKRFDLNDPKERQKYFELKAGPEIKKLREYLKKNTFIAYLLGKKNSGKGTYAKMFGEIVSPDKVAHVSIGDVVRQIHEEAITDEKKKEELIKWLKQDYRGYISLEETLEAMMNRDTKTLLPTEFILSLVKREISKMPRKALFVDGFPRGLDQISYSLFFRELINYRQDPDVFVLIDVPEAVINERIKYRRICPVCKTSRNHKLLPTSKIGFDKTTKEFYLMCDNPACKKVKMVMKEGDQLGIEPIRARLKLDQELIEKAFNLYGIPKVILRNSIPVKEAKDFVDDYEVTPEFGYEMSGKKIKVIEKPWQVNDDEGIPAYSLMPPPVVVSMIKQLVEILGL